jgi:hypothetical protein
MQKNLSKELRLHALLKGVFSGPSRCFGVRVTVALPIIKLPTMFHFRRYAVAGGLGVLPQ